MDILEDEQDWFLPCNVFQVIGQGVQRRIFVALGREIQLGISPCWQRKK